MEKEANRKKALIASFTVINKLGFKHTYIGSISSVRYTISFRYSYGHLIVPSKKQYNTTEDPLNSPHKLINGETD